MSILTDKTTITKYVLRVCHIGSLIALSYKIILDYMNGSLSTQHAPFFAMMGIVVAISGFINTYILKPQDMGEKRKLWVAYHHIKLLISILLFTVNRFIPIPVLKENIVELRFYFLLSIIFVSPFMRFYREFYSKKKQNKVSSQDSNDNDNQ